MKEGKDLNHNYDVNHAHESFHLRHCSLHSQVVYGNSHLQENKMVRNEQSEIVDLVSFVVVVECRGLGQ